MDDVLEMHKDKNYLVQLSTYDGSKMTKKMKEDKRDIKTDEERGTEEEKEEMEK